MLRIIAFCGPKGSGKDTAANYLLGRNDILHEAIFIRHNFADPLKAACGLIFGLTLSEMMDPALKEIVLDRWPEKSPRELMQSVAKTFRTLYSPDIWVRAWRRKLPAISNPCIVCTDLRHIEEYEALRELNAKIFYIANSRIEEERDIGISAGNPLWSDASEQLTPYLRANADQIIHNDGSIDELHKAVLSATINAYGDFHDWKATIAMGSPTGVIKHD